MQGGLHPDLKIEWYEEMLRGIKQRFPKIHLHCFSASEIIHFAEVSGLTIEDTIKRLRDAGLDSIPGGGAEILDDEVRYKIARLKCLTEDWMNVHRTAHKLGMRTTATMMFGVGENYQQRINHFQRLYDLLEENVVRSAGVTNCTTEEELRRIIRDAGFRPAQRDTLYRQYFLN